MEELVVLGAGGFAEEVVELATDAGFKVVAFIEGIDRDRCTRPLAGRPVIWIDDIRALAARCRAICAIGSTKRGSFIAAAAANNMCFVSIVHPRAHVSSSSFVGAGSLIAAGTILGAQCHIGAHVIINRGCLIGHHVRIGELSTISPGTNIGGHATVGEKCYIGMGAVVLDRIEIGAEAVVGAGAVVTQNVPAHVEVLGVPARISRTLK